MFPETFSAPFYLFLAREECEACGHIVPVVALASGEEEVFVFTEIREMPEAFELCVQAVRPEYRKVRCEFSEEKVYRNHCSCGSAFEDFYLYCEPEGAFFPLSDAEAEAIEVMPLPITGEHRIRCSPGMGTGEIVLKCGRWRTWKDLLPREARKS